MSAFSPLNSLTLDKKPKQELTKRQRERLSRSLKGFLVAYYSQKGYTYLWYTRSPERLLGILNAKEDEPLEIISIIPSQNTRQDIQRLYKIFENKQDHIPFWFALDANDLEILKDMGTQKGRNE